VEVGIEQKFNCFSKSGFLEERKVYSEKEREKWKRNKMEIKQMHSMGGDNKMRRKTKMKWKKISEAKEEQDYASNPKYKKTKEKRKRGDAFNGNAL
jgi:hypothetical protein